ncbi:hypothetical protein K7432_018203 [Basidiobolus ranarum]|uniref:LysM domain-containing protein n=1 Tax=Basidiobolus ranarum TaxID=34480 RepID=A0ABR2WCF7_9FUNG
MVNLAQLQKSNPGLDCDRLYVGQLICRPGDGTPTITTATTTTATSTPTPPKSCKKGTNQYSVQSGDTCYAIAVKFNISVENLQAANPNMKCEQLMVGEAVCIPSVVPSSSVSPTPTATPPTACASGTTSYSIKSGDTCSVIATNNGISVEKLLTANPKVKCELLAIGQQICIPQLCQNGEKASPVKAGDTCDKIAKSWKVTLDKLLKSNKGIDCNKLAIGQMICRPKA